MGHFIRKFCRVTMKILNTIIFLLTKKNNILMVNAYMELYGKKVLHHNFGDDLNYFMLRELTGRQIVNYKDLYIREVIHYCCIGSILNSLANKYSIVWGAGFISETMGLLEKPLKICAVRGKLTRQRLISLGIECPPVYGDPALLLPFVYTPIGFTPKRSCFHIGIIPHVDELNEPIINRLVMQYKDTFVIKFSKYKDWHDVINKICQCDFIISSSLHGIIISDAYNIPNIWAEFSDNIRWQYFKFRDYYSAVRETIPDPIKITFNTSLEELMEYKEEWRPIEIDLKKLLLACPFKLNLKI